MDSKKDKNKSNELNELEKRKIQQDCVDAPISAAGIDDRGKAMENLWFHEHEAELMEAARARKKKAEEAAKAAEEAKAPKASSTTTGGSADRGCCGGENHSTK